ncbi:MAG: hypothetical protein R6U78_09675 [Bacteroidales bacterium]
MNHNNYRIRKPVNRIRKPVNPIIFFVGFFILFMNNQLQAQDIEKDIMGRWILESTGDQLDGGILNFQENGTYVFRKDFSDGTRAELKGGYLLDSGSSPARLRLCLGDCSAAGSEWTSEFCILRITPDDMLEIFMSSAGVYPRTFPDDMDAERMYVFDRE